MGIWNGQQCRNVCAHAVTIGRMHVEVPHMWHYPMPECLHNAMILNKNVDRLAYNRIKAMPQYTGTTERTIRNRRLAFMGLSNEDVIELHRILGGSV